MLEDLSMCAQALKLQFDDISELTKDDAAQVTASRRTTQLKKRLTLRASKDMNQPMRQET